MYARCVFAIPFKTGNPFCVKITTGLAASWDGYLNVHLASDPSTPITTLGKSYAEGETVLEECFSQMDIKDGILLSSSKLYTTTCGVPVTGHWCNANHAADILLGKAVSSIQCRDLCNAYNLDKVSFSKGCCQHRQSVAPGPCSQDSRPGFDADFCCYLQPNSQDTTWWDGYTYASSDCNAKVLISAPTDAWVGSVMFSTDSGSTYAPGVCTNCTEGTVTTSIVVDGDSTNSANMADSKCHNGKTCQVKMPGKRTAALPPDHQL